MRSRTSATGHTGTNFGTRRNCRPSPIFRDAVTNREAFADEPANPERNSPRTNRRRLARAAGVQRGAGPAGDAAKPISRASRTRVSFGFGPERRENAALIS